MKYPIQADSLRQRENDVHVVRHDAPREQDVAVGIPKPQRIRDEISDPRVTQEACAGTPIEIRFNLPGQLRQPSTFSSGRLPLCQPRTLKDGRAFLSDGTQQFLRE